MSHFQSLVETRVEAWHETRGISDRKKSRYNPTHSTHPTPTHTLQGLADIDLASRVSGSSGRSRVFCPLHPIFFLVLGYRVVFVDDRPNGATHDRHNGATFTRRFRDLRRVSF